MMQKGVPVKNIMESNLVEQEISYNEWPEKSEASDNSMVPYNESKLTLRYKYPQVFRQNYLKECKDEEEKLKGTYQNTGSRVCKINFKINLLPSINPYEDDSVIEALASSDELELFSIEAVKDMLDYKFLTFAYRVHLMGFIVAITYILALSVQISVIYMGTPVRDDQGQIISLPEANTTMLAIQFICIVYKFVYDLNQFFRQGVIEYFQDFWNYLDILHISFNFLNFWQQYTNQSNTFFAQLIFVLNLLTCGAKLLFFLRIFKSLTTIVTMIVQVAKDL
jgi:hypothetical protein